MDSRLQKLRKLLKEHNVDGVFISSLPNITYITNFSGFSKEDRDAYLLVTKNKQFIFTHGIYKEAVQKYIPDFCLIAIKRENPMSSAIKDICTNEKIQKLGFESYDLRVSEYERVTKEVPKKMLKPTDLIGILRLTKDADEIQAVKKACELGDNAYSQILKKIKIGMTEKEIATELEFFIKGQGADISFSTIVAFGAHASMPHHVPMDIKLKQNSLVLIDFGVKLSNYCSDMTRTFFFGKATQKQKIVYQIVLQAQQKAITFIKNKLAIKESIKTSAVDKIARDYIIAQGFPTIPHSLGHGIGLEVHEAPRLTPLSHELLQEGMIFSIEPGIYLSDEFGVRLEDLFVIENNKLMQLTHANNHYSEL